LNKPNIIPGAPLFHIIRKQEVTLTDDNWNVTLQVETEEPSEVIDLNFLVPVRECTNSFTPFTLGRHVDHGWILIGKTQVNRPQILEVPTMIKAVL
jgi:hypothetical protein